MRLQIGQIVQFISDGNYLSDTFSIARDLADKQIKVIDIEQESSDDEEIVYVGSVVDEPSANWSFKLKHITTPSVNNWRDRIQ